MANCTAFNTTTVVSTSAILFSLAVVTAIVASVYAARVRQHGGLVARSRDQRSTAVDVSMLLEPPSLAEVGLAPTGGLTDVDFAPDDDADASTSA